jgi:hypothetical protein
MAGQGGKSGSGGKHGGGHKDRERSASSGDRRANEQAKQARIAAGRGQRDRSGRKPKGGR